MPNLNECFDVQERLLRAYDELTLAVNILPLQSIKTVRRLVLDCYWVVNELRLNPVEEEMRPIDDPDKPF